jgi:DnaJ-class molecular chaperone
VDKQHHTEAKNHTHSYIFLDKTMSTHYDVLNVSRSASMSEIKTAYHRILLKSHPDKTHMLGPFARSIADQKIRAANAAWEILSTPATKTAYDLSLPPLEQFGESAFESNTGFGSFGNGFGGGFGGGLEVASVALETPSLPVASEIGQSSQRSQTNSGQPTLHPAQTSKHNTMTPRRKP